MRRIARVASLLVLASVALAEGDRIDVPWPSLCDGCDAAPVTMDIGTCRSCKGSTSSGQYTLCEECARGMGLCQLCEKPLPHSVDMVLGTADGWTLRATVHLPKWKVCNGCVVLLHGLDGSRVDWAPLAPVLTKAGMVVVAFDLRGHGQSELTAGGKRPWKELKEAEYLLIPSDAAVMVRYARRWEEMNGRPVLVVGAGLGANAALCCAVDDPSIAGAALLSPSLAEHGLSSEEAIGKYGKRPIFLAASRDDKESAATVEKLATVAGASAKSFLDTEAGSGTAMLGKEDASGALAEAIAKWVSASAGEPQK